MLEWGGCSGSMHQWVLMHLALGIQLVVVLLKLLSLGTISRHGFLRANFRPQIVFKFVGLMPLSLWLKICCCRLGRGVNFLSGFVFFVVNPT